MKILVFDANDSIKASHRKTIQDAGHDVADALSIDDVRTAIADGKVQIVIATAATDELTDVTGDRIPVVSIDSKPEGGLTRKVSRKDGEIPAGQFKGALTWGAEHAPKLGTGRKGKRGRSGIVYPDGTKLVSVTYRGQRIGAATVGRDSEGRMVIHWNGQTFNSLTACSNAFTQYICNALGVDLDDNKATTSGSRFLFPEDTADNAEVRSECHDYVRKTDGCVAHEEGPHYAEPNPPKRGRQSKEKSDDDQEGTA
jgi:hypothetical protein